METWTTPQKKRAQKANQSQKGGSDALSFTDIGEKKHMWGET